jgi:anthranilate phosphoribosyltransferase
MSDLKPVLAKLATGARLSEPEAEGAFEIIMSGGATPSQIGAFLMALRLRGETVDEITAAARIMRAKVAHIEAPPGAIDIVGTGGDASGTLNISTGAALVVAGCGVPVAKHGNRALSSRSGAADVLKELGVNLDADFSLIARSMREAGIGFLMAPRHHAATRHVAPARVEMGTRTIFNMLGPLSNPSLVKRLLVGVYARQWVRPVAEALGKLGAERAWVVHGSDGLDEMTTTGATFVAEYDGGKLREFEVVPEEAGLPRATPEQLKGDDAAYNAAAMRRMLAGERGPFRDIVLYEAAAALIVAGKAPGLKQGVTIASESIDSGKARRALERMAAISQETVAAQA